MKSEKMSEVEKLVEEFHEIGRGLHTSDTDHLLKLNDWAGKACKELDAPTKFDVLLAGKYVMDNQYTVEIKQDRSLSFIQDNSYDCYRSGQQDLLRSILNGKLKPYIEPEPSAAELIENARKAVMEIDKWDSISNDGLENISIAIDAFEKLAKEKDSE